MESNKKTFTTSLAIAAAFVLIFCVFKTKQYYFSSKKSLDPKSLIDEKYDSEDLKPTRLPKLKIFINENLESQKLNTLNKNPKSKNTSTTNEVNQDQQIMTHKYIIKVLSQQQNFLRRCFENFLRSNSKMDSKGSVVVEFMVLPFGEIRDVEVKDSSFEDKTFQNCIKTVFLRTKVKKFEGEKFLITFPLEFE